MLTVVIVLSNLWNYVYGAEGIVYPGDIKIGVLFNIRETPSPYDPFMRCGNVRDIHSIQLLEAALLMRDLINNNTDILPGITLGLDVRDTCWSEMLALRQSLHLVRDNSTINESDTLKKQDKNENRRMLQENLIIQNPSVMGVIGPDTPEQSIQVQNLLKLLGVPQIGYSDTSPKFHDKEEYPTFSRVVPCDSYQTKVIRDILRKFNWTYIAIVHTSGVYGEGFLDHFRTSLKPKCSGACIAKERAIDPYFTDSDFDDIILDLNNYTSVNVIISFCERETLRELFKATKRLNLSDRFTFIASDGWANPEASTIDVEEQAQSTIFVMIDSPKIPMFSDYFTSLKPSENTRNPWFNKFWEQKFNCTLPIYSADKKALNCNDTIETSEISDSRKCCTGNESLSVNYYQDRKVVFVMKAIMAMAYGVHNMIIRSCGRNHTGLCPEMYPLDTSKLVDDLSDESFVFYNDWIVDHEIPRYDILNFQKLSDNKFEWIRIGDWRNETLNLNEEFQGKECKNITSTCSLPCPMGYRKIFAADNKNQDCCWECKRCNEYEYVSFDEEQCIACPQGEKPNATLTGCDKLPVTGVHWFEPIVLMVVVSTSTGLIGSILTLYVFMKYKDTPIVRASNRELCYLILVSMILIHISVYSILTKPSSFTCAISCISPAIGLTMMYAGLFTETYRIAEIVKYSETRFTGKKCRYISASSQIAFTFFCVVVETAICFAMILFSLSAPVVTYSSTDYLSFNCPNSVMNVIPLLTPIAVLHGLCIIYTFKAQNALGNCNKANCMGYAMLLSFIIWIISITVCFGTSFRTRPLSVCLTLIPSFTLILLFFPKLYIIIFKPEKNSIALFPINKNMRSIIKPGFRVNVSELIFENPVDIMDEDIFEISEHSCGLRRTVATQTSSTLFQNAFSLDDDGDESFSDDDVNFNPSHGLENSTVATISGGLEEKNYSGKNTFISRENLSFMTIDKFLSRKLDPCQYECLTRSGYLAAAVSLSACDPENNRDFDLDKSNSLPKDENPCVQKIKQTRIHEELTHEFHNGHPVFKITITLATESPENFNSSWWHFTTMRGLKNIQK